MNLKTLPNFAQTTSITEAATIFTKSRTKPVMRRCISHLPIQPPAWCRLPSDKITNGISFSQQLPTVFQLDNSSRCSCEYNGNYDENLKTVDPLVVYTSTIAVQHLVETVYCDACSNTHGKIGPDLGKYGILNWNNKVAFSHQLLNSYISQFTHSETPFNAFHLSIQDEYLNAPSPVEFCDDEIFEYAWFAFIRLQEIESSMQCSRCGPNPKVVIADGISVSFPSHHRTESLRPPTEPNKEHAWVRLRKSATKSTSFIGPAKSRASIYQALDTSDYMIRLTKLNVEIENLRQKSVLSHPTLCLQTLGSRTPRFLTLY